MREQERHSSGEGRESEEERPHPLFALGQVVGTPGALRALQKAEQDPVELLARHVTGDWGELPEEDVAKNERAVEGGYRVFSSYRLETGTKIYVITEWDRSVTTLLLPEDY
jgi:hypothetical protein